MNSGRVPATIVDDYIFELWRPDFPRIAANRDVAVSQDGSLSWVTRKDAPKLAAFVERLLLHSHDHDAGAEMRKALIAIGAAIGCGSGGTASSPSATAEALELRVQTWQSVSSVDYLS